MIVFAAIVPTSPLLFASINPQGLPLLEKTRTALAELAQDLAAHEPDTIVIFSEQVTMYDNAFSINVADPYIADLEDFGDLGYRKSYHPDFALVDNLQRNLRTVGEPISLTTDARLTHTTGVPLDFLTKHLPRVRILPIAPSKLDAKAHFAFGVALRNVLLASSSRIAVIAAGDTAHALNADSPTPAHPDGKAFDRTLIELLENNNVVGLLGIDDALRDNAKESVYRQTLMLIGALKDTNVTPIVRSYEAPLGVGHLVVEFDIE